jgi:hypothetical protein
MGTSQVFNISPYGCSIFKVAQNGGGINPNTSILLEKIENTLSKSDLEYPAENGDNFSQKVGITLY